MGENMKFYAVIIIIQLIYTGLFVISKAALDKGLSTFTFIFYRQLIAAIFLVPIAFFARERRTICSLTFRLSMKIFMHAFLGITFSLNVYNVGLRYTSATVASATTNSVPVITFFLALLMKMESIKFRGPSGISKILGVVLCFGGILTIAFYTGPQLKLLTKHQLFGHKTNAANDSPHSEAWMKGIFLMISANAAWSLWIVFQGWFLKEYPSKLLFTAIESVFSAIQSFVAAMAFERDFSQWKLRLDMGLLAIAYCGFVVTGVSFYLQSWCIEKKGPVFLAMSTPLALVFTVICSLFLGEVIPLGSVVGGILMVGGLYSVLWGKSKESIESSSSMQSIKDCNQVNEGASAHDHV